MSTKKTRVIIVDDSAVVRNILSKGLSKHPNLEVIATAKDPYDARDKIVKLKPDVITLDLEMPKMDGLEFISVLMKHWPIPIVIVSSLVEGNCETSLKALELGAVEVFMKPKLDITRSLNVLITDLSEIVLNAAKANIKPNLAPRHNKEKVVTLTKTTDKIIAIGASTGGTEAIKVILAQCPSLTPGILIVQHMPEVFTKAFADRLNNTCPQLEVREAVNGDSIQPGLALIAPGNMHLLLKKSGARYYAEIKHGPLVCRHRPSVDVLFESVAKNAKESAIGVILTGMGSDGAKGLLTMKKAGARTIAQDEESCVVYGMPKEATLNGAAEFSLPLLDIIPKIMCLV